MTELDRAHRNFAAAIIQQSVTDIMNGDPGAIEWLETPGFVTWCNHLDIDPDRARAAINARRATRTPRRTAEQYRRVREMHDRGVTWMDAIRHVFGYYSEEVRSAVMRNGGRS